MADKKLTVDQIEVPEEMFQVIYETWLRDPAQWTGPRLRHAVALGLLHLAENPIVPSSEDCQQLYQLWCKVPGNGSDSLHAPVTEWQRRMFLREPDPVPAEVRALMLSEDAPDASRPTRTFFNEEILKAYKLGLAAQEGN